MQLIRYKGWPVAFADMDDVQSTRRWWTWRSWTRATRWCALACALALHAFEVATGLQGPFDQGQAERFARALLMPGEEFVALVGEGDAALAEWFGVPAEQVPLRRPELRSPAARASRLPDCLPADA